MERSDFGLNLMNLDDNDRFFDLFRSFVCLFVSLDVIRF